MGPASGMCVEGNSYSHAVNPRLLGGILISFEIDLLFMYRKISL